VATGFRGAVEALDVLLVAAGNLGAAGFGDQTGLLSSKRDRERIPPGLGAAPLLAHTTAPTPTKKVAMLVTA
jgi:hypothetical protein